MLNSGLNRRPTTRRARIAILMACSSVTLPVAGFTQRTFATLSGSTVDSMNGILPEVTLVLTDAHTKAKHEVRTDRTGHFEFVGLPQGDYLLETWLAGFAPLQEKVTLVGQDWGGLIGLRLAAEHEDRFARIVASNTFLPTGDTPPGRAFLWWRLST